MKKSVQKDLLTSYEASDALFGKVSPQGIRKRVREGALRGYRKKSDPHKVVFVKRQELEELYFEQLYGWVAAAKKNGHK